ncbi:putative bifunctional diguanylate cyclase/phosphodiesterase [Aliikangiella coralliicola]|uniref:cyclic-guanylate-specific phosphodiesterase n=1 Tax=Aliikangiella coralliicola TaxID=2592383 RepID=A0A545UAN3_9GAMM|nr:EAL domain-containing protein [Aliikangiella coralliicola]TQV86519.1 EAL domain-containing protein [Aliikangiella coralliicola]
MKYFVNASIRGKIILITFFISLIVSIVMTSITAFKEFAHFSEAFEQRVQMEIQIISDNIGSALLFEDKDNLKETVESLFQDKAIVNVKVYDAEEHLFFELSSGAENIQPERIENIEKQIVVDGESIGIIRVDVFNHNLNEVIKNIIIAMFLNITISVVLAAILALIFQRLISAPILHLYSMSAQVAQTQNYGLRAEQYSSDEVGKLAAMFNHMLEKVEQRDEKLEKLVEMRTVELEKLADEFRHRAFHDSLTGLPNRAVLSERFTLAADQALRRSNKFACLLLDLDNFKTINDTKGHNYGDKLLVEVARRLKQTVRKEDLVCRLGGDEFVILLVGLRTLDALNIATRKILNVFSSDFYIKNERVKTGVSIGASLFPDHGESLNSIKRKADVAMYRAKDSGKNCFFVYTPDMQEDVKHRLMIQNDLVKALEEEQLVLYYQPKIYLKSNKVSGCEVLIRWQHPKEGFLTPAAFIPYAEESKLIIQLDYYVLRKSFETLKNWQSKGVSNTSLSVNLSGRHFTNFNIVKVIKEHLATYKIEPELLEIEITEAVLIEDPEVAQEVVSAIKKLRVRLSLDDFGTGYSSLNYLRTLPIDCIKLDHSFIQRIDISQQDRRLIKGIISLGKQLQIELVAEGVETESQLEILRALNCDYVQGYYFLKPVPETEFVEWLKRSEPFDPAQSA